MEGEGHGRSDLGSWGGLFSFLRWRAGGWTQAKLSRKSGIGKSQLSRYESGLEAPRRANAQRILSAFGVPLRLIELLRWCLRLIDKAIAAGQAEVPPEDEARFREHLLDAAERPLALARAELALLRRSPARRGPPTEEDHRRVEKLLETLKSSSEAKQRLLIQGSRAYRDPLLCVHMCLESERLAPDQPGEALKVAELALDIAGKVLESDGCRSALAGWCTGFVGNSQRVGSDLPLAEATFARSWRLWRAGADETGLLSEAHLCDLEASLRRDQRRFAEALRLHDRALAMARPEERGFILLNTSATLEQKGDYEASIAVLEEAAEHVDGERDPRLLWVLRFNEAACLIRLGRAGAAVPIVDEVRKLAARLGELDRVRTRWLEGNCAAGLGCRGEAHATLEEVQQAFAQRNLPFDYALASLDHALLFREEERFAEIKALAEEMLAIFKAQQVDQEAIAAVILFKEAAEKEKVTAEMVKRLADYLRRAQREPGAGFGG